MTQLVEKSAQTGNPETKSMTMAAAITDALDIALERDQKVVI